VELHPVQARPLGGDVQQRLGHKGLLRLQDEGRPGHELNVRRRLGAGVGLRRVGWGRGGVSGRRATLALCGDLLAALFDCDAS